jgi:hypothetical protein
MRLRQRDDEEKEKIGSLIVSPKIQTVQGQMNKAKKPGTCHLNHYKEKKDDDPVPQFYVVHKPYVPSFDYDELYGFDQFSPY